jgi:hypothetical protein
MPCARDSFLPVPWSARVAGDPALWLTLMIAVAALFGCDAKPTPAQIHAIEQVEIAKGEYSREFQPLLDSLSRCMDDRTNDQDPAFCGKEMAATPKPSSALYDLALKVCLEKGVPKEYCTGERKFK